MIETKGLIIKPLTCEQLKKYIRLDNSLETELNLKATSGTISDDRKEAASKSNNPQSVINIIKQ